QFHPEYKSRPLDPHPLFVSYIGAALAHRQQQQSARNRPAATAADAATGAGQNAAIATPDAPAEVGA
ncbi:MAG: hypothetical protein AAF772_08940, partial [Acidobacteriota bacterium]